MKHLIFFAILLLSCTEKQQASPKNNEKPQEHTAAESLAKIKDTTLIGNSAEGEAVELLINPKTKDSVIRGEALGETGKSEYLFIFNKTLKTAEVTTYRYAEPTNYNPKPKIVSKTTQTLSQNAESKETLTEIFQNYRNVFAGKDLKTGEEEAAQTADTSEKNGNAFPKSGKKASDFLPKSGIYEIQYEADGDLNGDGLKDLAVVMHSKHDNTAARPMLVLLQNSDKTFRLDKISKMAMPEEYLKNDFKLYDTEEIEITGGKLLIKLYGSGPSGNLFSDYKYLGDSLVLTYIETYNVGAGAWQSLYYDVQKGELTEEVTNTMREDMPTKEKKIRIPGKKPLFQYTSPDEIIRKAYEGLEGKW